MFLSYLDIIGFEDHLRLLFIVMFLLNKETSLVINDHFYCIWII